MTTIADLVQAVRAVANENPTFIYTSNNRGECQYSPTEENPKGCIMNAALNRLGIETDNQWEELNIAELLALYEGGSAPIVVDRSKDIKAVRWLCNVQTMQDNKTSWQGSVVAADHMRPLS